MGLGTPFDLVVDLVGALGDQKEATPDEDEVTPRDGRPEHREKGCGQAHDPREGEQQGHAADQSQGEAEKACPRLFGVRQARSQDRNENDVVDPENDFERGQGDERNPALGVGNPIHVVSVEKI